MLVNIAITAFVLLNIAEANGASMSRNSKFVPKVTTTTTKPKPTSPPEIDKTENINETICVGNEANITFNNDLAFLCINGTIVELIDSSMNDYFVTFFFSTRNFLV